jgi:hypothetical protein
LQGSKHFEKPLNSCSRFGERYRGRLLHEVVQNGSGSDGDNQGAQASDGKGRHLLSPNHPKFVTLIRNRQIRSIDKTPCSGRARKDLRFDSHKGSSEQTNS